VRTYLLAVTLFVSSCAASLALAAPFDVPAPAAVTKPAPKTGPRCFAFLAAITPTSRAAGDLAAGVAPDGFVLPAGYTVVAGGGLTGSTTAAVVVACDGG
jgi:hypothetical protein